MKYSLKRQQPEEILRVKHAAVHGTSVWNATSAEMQPRPQVPLLAVVPLPVVSGVRSAQTEAPNAAERPRITHLRP
eukprot:6185439-Pleurochrysis_carterae.AAC.1